MPRQPLTRIFTQERMAIAPNPNLVADAEVEAMMNDDYLRQSFRSDIGGNPASATPFNRWKIEKVYSSPSIKTKLN